MSDWSRQCRSILAVAAVAAVAIAVAVAAPGQTAGALRSHPAQAHTPAQANNARAYLVIDHHDDVRAAVPAANVVDAAIKVVRGTVSPGTVLVGPSHVAVHLGSVFSSECPNGRVPVPGPTNTQPSGTDWTDRVLAVFAANLVSPDDRHAPETREGGLGFPAPLGCPYRPAG
jgi:hypothetical protein